uniref:Uncharacterized protein n=1 Tax=Timema cristinae TaxID=61476 RepID=A0A7R9CHZ8_TIMCR|nr:unnamed protein product [Timema cristinae]
MPPPAVSIVGLGGGFGPPGTAASTSRCVDIGESNRPRAVVVNAHGYETRGTGFDSQLVPWISPSSAVELNTTSALANYATEAGGDKGDARKGIGIEPNSLSTGTKCFIWSALFLQIIAQLLGIALEVVGGGVEEEKRIGW